MYLSDEESRIRFPDKKIILKVPADVFAMKILI